MKLSTVFIALWLCKPLFSQIKYTIPIVIHVISPTAKAILTEKEIHDAL